MTVMKAHTLTSLKNRYKKGEKLACLTAYDATFAYWEAQAGVDVILVGDSLGMVVQGHQTTLPVTVEDLVYHLKMVQRGNQKSQQPAWCIADMPFMSDITVAEALQTAARFMKEGAANMVKLEGGQRVIESVKALSAHGIPVCAHLGLLPQAVEKRGYKAYSSDPVAAKKLIAEALALQSAGAEMLVLECVPAATAKEVTEALDIPVIGIGSGPDTSGQVLVINDILGITVGTAPRFVKNFMAEVQPTEELSIQAAIRQYIDAVKKQQFPSSEHQI